MGRGVKSLQDLVSRSVVNSDGCFEWQGAKSRGGYGVVNINGKARLAHRVSYSLAHGADICDPKFVCHRCDNPGCINPSHLFLGSAADNSADMKSKGRQQRGDSHWQAKLCSSDVSEIKQRLRIGEGQAGIAALFGVAKVVVSDINTGRLWADVQ